MRWLRHALLLAALPAVAGIGLLVLAPSFAAPSPRSFDGIKGNSVRGEYVLRIAGCVACHTNSKRDGEFLAGGRRLETAFGTFVTPNITPDEDTGIGGWTLEQFALSLTEGLSPTGDTYYPAFPYTSYTRMTAQDIADLKTYLDGVPPVVSEIVDHELRLPFRWRGALATWKLLFFSAGELNPDRTQSSAWNRGAYLVNGPSHCAECHTPRNPLGGYVSAHLAGTSEGPDGGRVPAISPRHSTEFAEWTAEDIAFALQLGMKPDGDSVDSAMGEVVDDSTGHMTEADLAAIAQYLMSAPASLKQ